MREPKRLIQSLSKLNNTMTELSNLAEKHLIENDLYHNTTINVIYDLFGEFRKRKSISETVDQDLDKKAKWKKLQEFLEGNKGLRRNIIIRDGCD